MIKLLLALHLWGLTLLTRLSGHTRGRLDRAFDTFTIARRERHQLGPRRHRVRDERGSVTIEQVIWAGAVIVIVGIVVAAITAYVKSKSGEIK
ncbi:hypothetical protein [Nocardioides marmoraquaticus]